MPIDPVAVAGKLTEAQRADLLAAKGGRWWSADGRTSKGMQRKGLIGTLNYTGSARLTPDGIAVRHELEKEKQ